MDSGDALREVNLTLTGTLARADSLAEVDSGDATSGVIGGPHTEARTPDVTFRKREGWEAKVRLGSGLM